MIQCYEATLQYIFGFLTNCTALTLGKLASSSGSKCAFYTQASRSDNLLKAVDLQAAYAAKALAQVFAIA